MKLITILLMVISCASLADECPTEIDEYSDYPKAVRKISALPHLAKEALDGPDCVPKTKSEMVFGAPLCTLGNIPIVGISVDSISETDEIISVSYLFPLLPGARDEISKYLAARYQRLEKSKWPETYAHPPVQFNVPEVFRFGERLYSLHEPSENKGGSQFSMLIVIQSKNVEISNRDWNRCK